MNGWIGSFCFLGSPFSHAHTLDPFGTVEYCYFGRGGLSSEPPVCYGTGSWLISHCTWGTSGQGGDRGWRQAGRQARTRF